MLVSRKLWFNDLYLLFGYAGWSFVGAMALVTTGNKRLFWLTVAISCFIFSTPSLITLSSGWLRGMLGVEGGGTQYGEFGNDVLTSDSKQDRRVASTLFWTFQRINAPLVLGAIFGFLRVLAGKWKVLLATAPLILGCCVHAWIPTIGLENWLQFLFGFFLVISLTFPVNSSPNLRLFWFGYSSAIATFAFVVQTNSTRFVFRNLSQAIHAAMPRASVEYVSALSQISTYALCLLFALSIGLACHCIFPQHLDHCDT